jgi:hypothetical protein
MPVGDCQRAFQSAAAADGVALVAVRVPWINRRGHFDLAPRAEAAVAPLDEIFHALGGDETAQRGKTSTALTGDLYHEPSGTFIEIDESQHFTSFRLATFALYPSHAPLGFDVGVYRRLCEEWRDRSDRYRATKDAVGFGMGGRQRQRAYNDALRDLVVPTMGHPPLIRIPAPTRDGAGAYAIARDTIAALAVAG